jgi:hypothetical protein
MYQRGAGQMINKEEYTQILDVAWEIINNGPLHNENIQKVRYAIRQVLFYLEEAPPLTQDVEEALEYVGKSFLHGTGGEYREELKSKYLEPIKQALQTQQERIKEATNKLHAIREILDSVDDKKAGTGDSQRLEAYYKIKEVLDK